MPRRRAIAMILRVREELLANAAEPSANGPPPHEIAAELDRLLLDVRAGRVDAFELSRPTPVHVMICPD